MDPHVITWDYYAEPGSTAETWLQVASNFTIAGGLPNIVAASSQGVYRHTADGRTWKLDRKEVPAL